jgi:5-hydroxyisourate hydrolase-like protein (transthyretin family)
MNTQNKLINDIMSTYGNILENKRIVERAQDLRNTLKSLGYSEKGSEISSGGEITSEISNIVSEILKEYKKTNPDVSVKITGGNDKYHQGLSYNSKHKTGNAIDVTIEPYNSKNANDFISIVKKFIQKYRKLGFRDEYTNPSKAATGKHFHLEYNSEGVANNNVTNTNSVSDNSTDNDKNGGFLQQVGRSLVNAIGIKESLDYTSLGKKTSLRFGDILIPKKENSNIKSPVSGVVSKYFNDCNGLTIKFESESETLYLNYCGIESSRFRIGQKIKKGEVIGSPDSDVKVSVFNSNGNKQKINSNKKTDSDKGLSSFFKTDSKTTTYPDKSDSKDYSRYDNELAREFIKMKDNLFKVNKKDKLEENIKRIKGLL